MPDILLNCSCQMKPGEVFKIVLKQLTEQIEELRNEIHKLVIEEKKLNNGEVLKKSQRLDALLNELYRNDVSLTDYKNKDRGGKK